MLTLKGCSRCGGDVYSDRDQYGPTEYCLQCGRAAEPGNSQHKPDNRTLVSSAGSIRQEPNQEIQTI